MAVADDLQKLAAGDIVYLQYSLGSPAARPTAVYRGRLRQSLNGEWVFVASNDQNGVTGFILGGVNPTTWTSSEAPSQGIWVQLSQSTAISGPNQQGTISVWIVLTSLIPSDFAD